MRFTQLRFALLASLGVLPLACSGTIEDGSIGTASGKCTSPSTDPDTGLVTCDEGYTHRPTAMTCGSSVVSSVDQTTLPRADGLGVTCELEPSACDSYRYGYCQGGYLGSPSCASGCATDQDCGDGFVCSCGAPTSWGSCVSATCTTNADCAPGYRCASHASFGGGYACQTPNDKCDGDQDCSLGSACQVQADGTRQCAPRPIAGRPFLVAHQIRVAPILRRNDWLV